MRYVSSITCSLIPLHLFHPPVRAWFDAVSPAPTRPPQFGWPARALAETGGDDSALLPHLKARAGETQPAVTGQVLESLLATERRDAFPVVSLFLAAAHQVEIGKDSGRR